MSVSDAFWLICGDVVIQLYSNMDVSMVIMTYEFFKHVLLTQRFSFSLMEEKGRKERERNVINVFHYL